MSKATKTTAILLAFACQIMAGPLVQSQTSTTLALPDYIDGINQHVSPDDFLGTRVDMTYQDMELRCAWGDCIDMFSIAFLGPTSFSLQNLRDVQANSVLLVGYLLSPYALFNASLLPKDELQGRVVYSSNTQPTGQISWWSFENQIDDTHYGSLRLGVDLPPGALVTFDVDPDRVTVTPEPFTMVLVGSGLIAGSVVSRRRRKKPA